MKRLLPIFALLFLSLFALSACRSPLTPAESQSSSESEKTGTEIDNFATLQNGVVIVLAEDRSSYTVTGYTGTDTTVVIPSEYKGVTITAIGDSAFRYCDSAKSLTSVVIPDSVTIIGDYAFYECTGLTSVTIPDSVTVIGEWTFAYCNNLTSAVIPDSVKNVGKHAFYYCAGLTSVTIGNSVTIIGDYAFYECRSLTAVTIPDSVADIGRNAFSYCTALTSVTIPNSIESVGYNAFYGCSNLVYNEYNNAYYLGNSANPYVVLINAKDENITSCAIHEDTKFIISYAFSHCYRLARVAIPNSVTSISECAFSTCRNLTSITIGDMVTVIGKEAFYSCDSLTNVYYHGTAEEWSAVEIGDYNEDLTNATRYYYSETRPTNEGNFWHYDNSGNIVVW